MLSRLHHTGVLVRLAMAASVCAGADKTKVVKHTHQI